MAGQMDEKKYRAYCFGADWPAIVDRYLFIRGKVGDNSADNGGKIFGMTGATSASASDLIFTFTEAFVVAASDRSLPGVVIRSAINNLSNSAEQNIFTVTEELKARAINDTLPVLHPECILEWVNALGLQISEDQFKNYAREMARDDDLVGAAILISKFKFHDDFDIADLVTRLIEGQNRIDVAK